MKDILKYLFDYNTLTKEEAKSIMTQIPRGVFNDFEITSFITAFKMRSITIDELRGFVEALRMMMVKVDVGTSDLVEIVGTGGDGKDTFNISTLSCFLVAGAGQLVAKHGNVSASSVSGSSNVMQLLGVNFYNEEDKLRAQLEAANICFVHAPIFHPSLKSVVTIRKQLGFRTSFNLLGPLVNPLTPDYPTLGVSSSETARLYNYVLQQDKKSFCIVHALDGYDEISLTGETLLITEDSNHLLSPEELLSQKVTPQALYGGQTKEQAAALFLAILEGKGTQAQNEVVITNAAVALHNTKKYGDLNTCRAMAKLSLESGAALNALQELIKI